MDISRDDLLYLAGIIDMSASISFSKQKIPGNGSILVYYYPVMSIYDASKDYLLTLRDIVGFGGIYNDRCLCRYKYHIQSDVLVALGGRVLPFLRRKYQRVRMKLAVDFRKGDQGRNESLYSAMRETTKQMGRRQLYLAAQRED